MNNPECAACGHVSRPGAASCEMCDRRFEAPGRAGDADYSGDSWGWSGEPAGRSWPGEDSTARGDAGPSAGVGPDDIPSPPFKGAGDVFAPTLEVYRKHFVLVGLLVLVTTLPAALLQYGLSRAMMHAVEGGFPGELPGLFRLMPVLNLVLWLLSVAGLALLSGSLVYAVIDIQRAGRASAAACLRRGLEALPRVFLVVLLYKLVTVVGLVLFIVPGVVFMLMYAVAVPLAVTEGRGPFEALKRSAALTDGFKGLIFLTYFLWWLLMAALTLVVTWSFVYSGALEPLPALLLLSTVTGMLNSSMDVLTTYIFLGLLNERAHGFETRAFTPGPEAAAR